MSLRHFSQKLLGGNGLGLGDLTFLTKGLRYNLGAWILEKGAMKDSIQLHYGCRIPCFWSFPYKFGHFGSNFENNKNKFVSCVSPIL